ncbi:MAG: hypothetical protein COA43_00565 [Robiginitomaculum sp.]|nr:MAG: hypothetical protein COA43_00565 [Robiginitomaculum sp.]
MVDNYFQKLRTDEKIRINQAVDLYLLGQVTQEYVFLAAKGRRVVNKDFVRTFLTHPALLQMQANRRGIEKRQFAKRIFDLIEAETQFQKTVPWRLN